MTLRVEEIIRLPVGSVARTLPPVLACAHFRDIAIDSRAVQPGDLFVALAGEQTDGHRYVAAAIKQGAQAALVRRSWVETEEPGQLGTIGIVDNTTAAAEVTWPALIAVDDPLETLQALAAHHRAQFGLPIVGITGSVGKTSTRALAAHLLGQELNTLASVKSFNNEIGVPLTLLRLQPEHQVAVLEMGTYMPGDIALLCALARPRYGIVTNVGVSHLERMATRDVVARAKAELVVALPEDGVAILNGDDERVLAMRAVTPARCVTFGLGDQNDLRATAIESHGLDGITFTVEAEGEQHHLATPLLGRHSAYTALAALALARELGVSWPGIDHGLSTATEPPRLVIRPGYNGATLLDDSYNASPVSCRAALDVLAEMPGRHVAVFSEMAELGPEEIAGHHEVGEATAGIVDVLILIGAKARMIGDAAAATATPPEIVYVENKIDATRQLKATIGLGDYVLIKGARVAATETIVQALQREGAT